MLEIGDRIVVKGCPFFGIGTVDRLYVALRVGVKFDTGRYYNYNEFELHVLSPVEELAAIRKDHARDAKAR